jgi:pimeloyl-ACP methyl ester carboxylesterase
MSRQLRTLRQATGKPDLIVLLPGAYMSPENFVQAGFFSVIEQRGLQLDIILVDLDLEMISEGSAVPAIVDQIVLPARQKYGRIWLGGISLGGLLSLCLNADHPGAVDGLCLIAPYPGSRLTTNAINRAGGLDIWQATDNELTDPEFRAYRWLKAPPAEFPVFVGYGSEDRFAGGMKAIAERFPENTRCAVPGGHDWPAWQVLWEHFLDLGHFPA